MRCTDSDWKDKKINVRRMHPPRAAHAQVLESKTHSAEAELGAAVKASQEVLGMTSLWNDVGETTWRHVMEDASAEIAQIIRRMVLGKVRHLNT